MDEKTMLFLFTQVVSVAVIIVSNKTDIKWLTNIQQDHATRIVKLEDKKAG
ncbi:hypothetical protein HQQ94_12700 [Shewanella sp. VB17]|uniref:hypothetical protein n=1 Tax=Shewanella sp. VB17 TaxID=2739432 RepID=UPI001565572B|nr:hypothetical protein [Shewanella sp. VB17]NRD74079.1 hypothetical protein [Shewanella sp. VB17]